MCRTGDAVDPKPAGTIRLVVAGSNRSDYGRGCANADLRRAGLSQAAIDQSIMTTKA